MADEPDNGTGEGSGPQSELTRELSCFDVTMLGVGAMIGAGIFVLTGIAAGQAGPALLLSFALNAIVTVFTAMVYAELGSSIPEAGGGYLWIKHGLPGGNAFLGGWMSWFSHAVAGSLYALGFGAYVQLMLTDFGLELPFLGGELGKKVLAVLIIAVFLYINYRGSSETGKAGRIITLAKIVILAIFVGSGLWKMLHNPESFTNFQPFSPNGLAGVFTAMGLTFVAFEGYEIIVQAGEEVKDPRRNIPRAVFWSLLIVVPIYILVAFVALGAVQPESGQATWQWLGEHAEVGLVEAAKQFMPFGTFLLLIGGLVSTMSALNATTFSSTRVSFAMGRDKNLPDFFASIHEKTRTPFGALLASGAIIAAMAIAVPIHHVAAAADIMFLLLFLQVNLAVIRIRKQFGDKLRYGYLMPFFPIVPIIGIVTKLFLAVFMFHYSALAWYVAIGWLAVGYMTYRLYAKDRERERAAAPVVLSELQREEKERYRVLVPVGNPENAEGLMQFAGKVARVFDGEVIVLNVLTVPMLTPVRAGRELAEKRRQLIDDATAILEKQGIICRGLVRITHAKPSKAIIDTVDEHEIDFVVMGWQGQDWGDQDQVGSNIDLIVKQCNSDLVILPDALDAEPEKVLVPIADPPSGGLMLQVARLLVADRDSDIDLLHVMRSDEEREEAAEELRDLVDEATSVGKHPRVSVDVLTGRDPVGRIVEKSGDYNALVMGFEPAGWVTRKIFSTDAQRIHDQARCPLVLVRPPTAALKHSVQKFFSFFHQSSEEDIDPDVSEEEVEEADEQTDEEEEDGA